MFKKILNSEFSRNVSSQILGTGIAQLLPFLATPLLTRLYTEEDFALYTSFFALATIFAVAAGAKYPLAIVLPKKKIGAMRLFTLSIYLTVLYAIVVALLLAVVHKFYPFKIGTLVYFIPVYVLFYGLWNAFILWSIRNKSFKVNAYAKVLQSGSYIAAAIGLGVAKVAALGLVAAKVFGTLASFIFLYGKSGIRAEFIPWAKLGKVARKYIDYPKYGVAPAFLNTISSQALILILTQFYATKDLGYFGLTYMVLSAPLGLIGNSFKDVFYQRIAHLVGYGHIKEAITFFNRSALTLLLMGVPIGLILFFFGPELFGFVFGDSWERSGLFAAILALSFVFKLVVSPLSSIFNATNRLKVASIWQVTYFITTFGTLGYCAYVLKVNVEILLYVYVAHEVILYGLYLLLQKRTLKQFLKPGSHV